MNKMMTKALSILTIGAIMASAKEAVKNGRKLSAAVGPDGFPAEKDPVILSLGPKKTFEDADYDFDTPLPPASLAQRLASASSSLSKTETKTKEGAADSSNDEQQMYVLIKKAAGNDDLQYSFSILNILVAYEKALESFVDEAALQKGIAATCQQFSFPTPQLSGKNTEVKNLLTNFCLEVSKKENVSKEELKSIIEKTKGLYKIASKDSESSGIRHHGHWFAAVFLVLIASLSSL